MPPRSLCRRALRALMPAALAALPLAASAQVATVDEGSFVVTRGGARLGREDFRIARQPAGDGAAYVARATATYGDRRIVPALQTDGDGVPDRYQVEVRRAGVVEQRCSAQAAGGHFRAQSVSDGGEAAREFLLEPGTVVVDDELYHQYYFLVRRAPAGGGARVTVLAPRRGAQAAVTVTLDGAERLTVGGRPVEARHYVLTDRAGGRREVWADDQGRVLRVVLPAEGIEAVRDDPPR
jgi:hypothetical protein